MSEFILTAFGDEIGPDLDFQMDVLEKCGISHIEFRAAYGKNVSVFTEDEIKDIKKKLDKRHFKVSAVGSPIGKIKIHDDFAPHFELFKKIVKFAHLLETRYIRVFSFFLDEQDKPEDVRDEVMKRMAQMVAYAEKENVILVCENERFVYGDTPERAKDLTVTLHSKHFGLAYDCGNFVYAGIRNFPEAFPLLKDHIYYMHMKDCVSQASTYMRHLDMGFQNVSSYQRILGTGDAQIKEIIKALDDMGYQGFLSIEPHLTDGAIPNTSDDARFIAAALGLKQVLAEVIKK